MIDENPKNLTETYDVFKYTVCCNKDDLYKS